MLDLNLRRVFILRVILFLVNNDKRTQFTLPDTDKNSAEMMQIGRFFFFFIWGHSWLRLKCVPGTTKELVERFNFRVAPHLWKGDQK